MSQGYEGWTNLSYHWYLGVYYARNFATGLGYFLTWMVIHNYLIPIALFVELEMQKFLSSMFFAWDVELYDADRDLPARGARTYDVCKQFFIF